jgi:hypothetical protein
MVQEYNENKLLPPHFIIYPAVMAAGSLFWPALRALIAVFMNPGEKEDPHVLGCACYER